LGSGISASLLDLVIGTPYQGSEKEAPFFDLENKKQTLELVSKALPVLLVDTTYLDLDTLALPHYMVVGAYLGWFGWQQMFYFYAF